VGRIQDRRQQGKRRALKRVQGRRSVTHAWLLVCGVGARLPESCCERRRTLRKH
jgi:hypothetical protein